MALGTPVFLLTIVTARSTRAIPGIYDFQSGETSSIPGAGVPHADKWSPLSGDSRLMSLTCRYGNARGAHSA